MPGQKRQRVGAKAPPDDRLHASSCKMTRASIPFKETAIFSMDCRVKPGNDKTTMEPAHAE
jgi:hypothetical protein